MIFLKEFFVSSESKCLRFFFISWAEKSCTWAILISKWLSKMHFICLEELFQGECSFSEKKTLTVWCFRSEFGPNFFRILEKNVISTKQYQYGCHHCFLHFQKDFFGNFYPQKNQRQKHFRNWSGTSLIFVETFWKIREKCITACSGFFWGKIYVFWRNNRLQLFLSRWQEICRSLAK